MTTTVCSNDTLVDTPFQLISGFFHVNQGVYSVVSMLSKLPPRVCWRGGGGGATGLLNKATCRLPGLVTKQQAVEFPQVQADYCSLPASIS